MTWVIHHYFLVKSIFLLLTYSVLNCIQLQYYLSTINIYPPLIQLPFNTKNFNIFSTSPTITYLCTQFLPEQSPEKLHTPLSLSIGKYCVFSLPFINYTLLHTLLFTVTLSDQTVSFAVSASKLTHILARIFTIFFPNG